MPERRPLRGQRAGRYAANDTLMLISQSGQEREAGLRAPPAASGSAGYYVRVEQDRLRAEKPRESLNVVVVNLLLHLP